MAGVPKFTGWRPRHGALVGALLGGLLVTAPAWGAPSITRLVTTPLQAESPAPRTATAPPPARVLLMGDSVMDQQGNAAAFVLRQAGVDARAEGWWGSSLFTTDQYDDGKTKPAGLWLKEARRQIDTFDPQVVAVYLNHNFWPPHPRDAAGRTIDDLWSSSGQTMIHQQVVALLAILRSRGAQVFFVTPIPAGTTKTSPDPNVWNPIWHGYLPVLRAFHVPVIDSGHALEGAAGYRTEAKPDCGGSPSLVRPPANLHQTRFGASLTGTIDAQAIAHALHVDLHDNVAPGDRTVALVPSPAGGYWLVGCEGSVYHFGAAAPLAGAHSRVAGHGGVVGAVATASGHGLWLVTADGTIAAIGDAPRLSFSSHPAARLVAVASVSTHNGLLAVDATGAVLAAGHARALGGISRLGHAPVVGITATPDGKGYWVAGRDGGVFAFGDARFYGSMGGVKLQGAVAGVASTPDGRGYWLVGADGGIFSFGDAHYSGNGLWTPPAYPKNLFTVAPGPTVAVVAAPGSRPGYWTLGNTGRVTNHGAASGSSGDNNLALNTQSRGQPPARLTSSRPMRTSSRCSDAGPTISIVVPQPASCCASIVAPVPAIVIAKRPSSSSSPTSRSSPNW